MATIFVYSVADDTPTQASNDTVLTSDINASAIAQTLVSAVTVGDVITITFLTDLADPSETDILNAIIASHLQESFPFSLSTDFPSGLDASVLDAQIRASSISSAVLDGINIEGDVVTINFDDFLVFADSETLKALVAAHDGSGFEESVQLLLSEGEQTNTTTTFAEAARIDSGFLRAGYYLILFTCELAVETNNGTSGCEVQLEWNGAERAIHRSGESLYTTFSIPVTLEVNDLATPSLVMNFRRIGTANTAKVRRIRMSITPVMQDVQEE